MGVLLRKRKLNEFGGKLRLSRSVWGWGPSAQNRASPFAVIFHSRGIARNFRGGDYFRLL